MDKTAERPLSFIDNIRISPQFDCKHNVPSDQMWFGAKTLLSMSPKVPVPSSKEQSGWVGGTGEIIFANDGGVKCQWHWC